MSFRSFAPISNALAAEWSHWYDRDGKPVYEVSCKTKEGNRPTNISDARKLDLVPSVTLILRCAAAPGLEAWKARQILEAALTLPQLAGETLDDYAERVIKDSQEQARKAREKGTELHAAIEDCIRGQQSLIYQKHCEKIREALLPYDVDLLAGEAEHSFCSGFGYGGKIDYHRNGSIGVVADFKSKDRLDSKLKCYDEHLMQLAAYGHGVFAKHFMPDHPEQFRAFNVFVGIEDCEVRVFEHTWDDLANAFSMFCDLLSFWKKKNRFI